MSQPAMGSHQTEEKVSLEQQLTEKCTIEQNAEAAHSITEHTAAAAAASSVDASLPPKLKDGQESVQYTPLSHIHPSNVPDKWTIEFPPVRDEHGELLPRQHPPSIEVRKVNSTPLILRVEEFVTKEECAEILRLAYSEKAPTWRPYRSISYKPTVDADTGEVLKQEFLIGHTEQATMYQLDYGHYVEIRPVITMIGQRVSRLVNLPITRTSNMRRLLRYQDGQKFDLHADDFDRIEPRKYRGRRLLTCLIYIHTEKGEEGGGTVFPLLDSGSWRSPPISGSLLIFRNFDPQNEFKFDSRCQHYAEPTVQGSKYVINAYQVEGDGPWWH